MCEIQDCGVCECKRPEFLSDKDVASARESDSPCQRQLDSQKLVHMSANDIFSKPWTTPGEVAELPKMEVVDLLRNPELYTGYNGSRIWVRVPFLFLSEEYDPFSGHCFVIIHCPLLVLFCVTQNAIHHENCFKPQRSNSWCEVLLPVSKVSHLLTISVVVGRNFCVFVIHPAFLYLP